MSAGVYLVLSTEKPGALLAIRDEIQALDPHIRWLYDDVFDELETDGYFKWPLFDEDLRNLASKYPEYKLYWRVDYE